MHNVISVPPESRALRAEATQGVGAEALRAEPFVVHLGAHGAGAEPLDAVDDHGAADELQLHVGRAQAARARRSSSSSTFCASANVTLQLHGAGRGQDEED